MKYKQWIDDVNKALLSIIGRELTLSDQKSAKKLYNKRYSADDAVSVLLTKI